MYFSCVWSSGLAPWRRNRITLQLAWEMTVGHRSKDRAAHRRYETLRSKQYKENGRILSIPFWQLTKFSLHNSGTYAVCRSSNKLHGVLTRLNKDHLMKFSFQGSQWCYDYYLLSCLASSRFTNTFNIKIITNENTNLWQMQHSSL
jgi:hypothetical protein